MDTVHEQIVEFGNENFTTGSENVDFYFTNRVHPNESAEIHTKQDRITKQILVNVVFLSRRADTPSLSGNAAGLSNEKKKKLIKFVNYKMKI